MEQVAHLYKITNLLTGQYYVGKHNGWSQNGYWGSGKRIKYNIEKHGVENFKYDILCYGSVKYILELEGKYVTKHLLESDNKCLNLVPGGLGIEIFTDEVRKKLSAAKKGHIMYNDTKRNEKIRQSLLGIKHTEERKDKIRQKAIGRKQSIEQIQNRVNKIKKLIWVHNGEKNRRIPPELFEEFRQNGFTRGQIIKRKNLNG
jgi:hypothetical protein